MAAMRLARRNKNQLPPCYYEGILEKRSFRDKISHKFWASLCGNCLFFYNNNKDNDYVEKLDLSTFISVTDDRSHDRRLGAARFHLRLKGEDVDLTAPSLEARELWKGFIFSVVKLDVPSSLNLLPGQIHMLRQAVDKEMERHKKSVATSEANDYMPVLSDMPACFYRVPREEAETFLEKQKDKGNLLLRPSREGGSFAVTTRQELDGPVFRHYRVTRIPDGGFTIVVDNPISCPSLHDVVSYMMEKTGVFKPLVLENTYEQSIEYVVDNNENGERSVISASPISPVAPITPPKPAPRRNKEAVENFYLNSSDEEEVPTIVVPRPPAKTKTLVPPVSTPDLQFGRGGALLPPTTRPRSSSETVTASKPWKSSPPRTVAFAFCEDLNAELKEKFQLRRVSE